MSSAAVAKPATGVLDRASAVASSARTMMRHPRRLVRPKVNAAEVAAASAAAASASNSFTLPFGMNVSTLMAIVFLVLAVVVGAGYWWYTQTVGSAPGKKVKRDRGRGHVAGERAVNRRPRAPEPANVVQVTNTSANARARGTVAPTPTPASAKPAPATKPAGTTARVSVAPVPARASAGVRVNGEPVHAPPAPAPSQEDLDEVVQVVTLDGAMQYQQMRASLAQASAAAQTAAKSAVEDSIHAEEQAERRRRKREKAGDRDTATRFLDRNAEYRSELPSTGITISMEVLRRAHQQKLAAEAARAAAAEAKEGSSSTVAVEEVAESQDIPEVFPRTDADAVGQPSSPASPAHSTGDARASPTNDADSVCNNDVPHAQPEPTAEAGNDEGGEEHAEVCVAGSEPDADEAAPVEKPAPAGGDEGGPAGGARATEEGVETEVGAVTSTNASPAAAGGDAAVPRGEDEGVCSGVEAPGDDGAAATSPGDADDGVDPVRRAALRRARRRRARRSSSRVEALNDATQERAGSGGDDCASVSSRRSSSRRSSSRRHRHHSPNGSVASEASEGSGRLTRSAARRLREARKARRSAQRRLQQALSDE